MKYPITKTVTKPFPIILLIFLCILLINGCSEQIETSVEYGLPNWTYDGRITAVKKTTQSSRSWSNSSFTAYSTQSDIVIMDEDGGNESVLINDEEFYCFMSPDGTMMSGIQNIYSYPDKEVLYDLSTVAGLQSTSFCGWAPSGNGHVFVYVIGSVPNSQLRLINLDNAPVTDTLVTTNVFNASWMYGERIYYAYLDLSEYLYKDASILSDGTGYQDYGRKGVSPAQVLSGDPTKVFGVGIGVPYGVFDIDNLTSSPDVVLSDYSANHPLLHPDGTKIIDSVGGWGIYITNLGTGVTTRLK